MNTKSAVDQSMFWRVSHDLLGVADGKGTWLELSPSWFEVLGWDVEEMIGKSSAWLWHQDDVLATQSQWSELAAGRALRYFENRLRTRDGTYRRISWRAVPHAGLIYATGRDVTREVEHGNALSDQQDFARLALTAVEGVGVWTYDVSTDFFTCDAAVCELYAIDAEQGAQGIERNGFLANVHPEDRAALAVTMAGGLERSGDLELEYRIVHPDGVVRSVLSRGHTYFDTDGKPTRRTGVAVETTKRRLLEEQLRQSQKMEAVGQLTGGLAHDFNNLLTGISGGLELMHLRMTQGRFGDLDRYIIAAQGAAKRAAALTHRLLAFSRRQTLEPRVVDVNRLVAGIEDLIRRTIGPEIALEPLIGAAGLWPTLVDPGQLENALLNLCINAKDAMPDGGKITIETGHRWVDHATGQGRDLPAGQYVTLCVSDTGTGMPAAVIARAFDPFYTTKPMGMGTGLGLSMVYGFAKQSHGDVRIYSEVGVGTMVCIYLPRHHGDADIEAPDTRPALDLRSTHDETILIVDDEPTVRMLVVDVLEDHGYHVLEAADGASALRILKSGARIDLLITDVGLPGGINGRQLANAARGSRDDMTVLFITGYAENAVLSHGHLDRDMHVLTKPFAVADLVERVSRLLRKPN